MPARNTLVQLLALYTDPESHNAQRYRQTDRDGRQDDANSPSYCAAVRSTKTQINRLLKTLAAYFLRPDWRFYSRLTLHMQHAASAGYPLAILSHSS